MYSYIKNQFGAKNDSWWHRNLGLIVASPCVGAWRHACFVAIATFCMGWMQQFDVCLGFRSSSECSRRLVTGETFSHLTLSATHSNRFICDTVSRACIRRLLEPHFIVRNCVLNVQSYFSFVHFTFFLYWYTIYTLTTEYPKKNNACFRNLRSQILPVPLSSISTNSVSETLLQKRRAAPILHS